jgi:hypothetical protein
MRHSISFLERDYESLTSHLFGDTSTEQAAFLLGRTVETVSGRAVIVRRVIPVLPADILSASRLHMSIRSLACVRIMKEADATNQCIIFVHSHPGGLNQFSKLDDTEEAALFKSAYNRVGHAGFHASLVFSGKDKVCGRFWFRDGSTQPVDLVKSIGPRFRLIFNKPECQMPLEYFDRQALAFTKEFQPILNNLRIGVVGFGGTGSAVCEQLIRLGVGKLLVVDNGFFEKSNVNRVYGSTVFDEKLPKANIAARLSAMIGLRTEVEIVGKHLSFRSAAERLRDCDVVFGCTDDEWGRSILNRLAIAYYLPVFDLGVNIDTDQGLIRGIQGRVTTLMPGAACLFCRKRISTDRIRAESISELNPQEATKLRKEGYLANIDEPAPSVIAFSSGISALAVSEFLHRLTGFQGSDRQSTETLCLFDQSRIRTNSTAPSTGCFCASEDKWGLGDQRRFLDLTWRQE